MTVNFLSFESAKGIVRSLNLSGREEWRSLIAEGKLPANIPKRPDHFYKSEWNGWKDWFGYEGHKPRTQYMPFKEARDHVQRLGLRTLTEWRRYHKANFANKKLKQSIPINPQAHYSKEWISLEDWLGNSYQPYASNRKKRRLEFDQCREFARKLGFKKQTQWCEWAKSNLRPDEVPSNPDQYYKESGWSNWADWLGVKSRGKWLDYEAAAAIVRSKKFQTYKEFENWCSREDFPSNIPKDPRYAYASRGWKNTADWLGNGKVRRDEVWDFYRAREWVQSYVKKRGEVITHKKWNEFAKSENKPPQILTNPTNYPEFVSWSDWFGRDDNEWLSFNEARNIVRKLELRNKNDWICWINSESYDPRIPKAPNSVYKEEWAGMPDWLGSSHRRHVRNFRSYSEAKKFVRSLKLQNKNDWESYVRSGKLPMDIPVTPSKTYAKDWVSWSDWLGNYGARWSKESLVGFLKALVPILGKLEPSELFAILRKNNCLDVLDSLGENNPLVMITKAALNGEQSKIHELTLELGSNNDGLPQIDSQEIEEIDPVEIDESINSEILTLNQDKEDASLPSLTAREILDAIDEVSKSIGISDEETINFLIDKGVSRLWQSVLSSSNQNEEVEKARAFTGDTYAQIIKSRFIEEFDAAQAIPIPKGYAFKKAGKLVAPNLMQRLIAYRLIKMKRVGNWSGTGAGKTLAAILGSRAIGANLTIVVALNNTINDPNSGWSSEIKSAFPDSKVQIKDRGSYIPTDDASNYLLLNYESFQLAGSNAIVKNLVDQNKIDLIVLDEIHSAKSRNAIESKRRQLLNYLITEASKKNSDLKVLGMSATPVVNSLDEAASLLEMITSKNYSDLDTRATISNALGIHQQLILNGVRYRPNYEMELHEKTIEVRADGLTDQILSLKRGDVLGLENILLKPKLPCVLDISKPGTIIFSNFVEGIFNTVSEALNGKGLKVARFNGEDKSGLEQFKKGQADILIGSSALGTGVDGLQYICNRLVILTLPWTSAGYEQLLGRIYRQGSRFENIEVFIPQVILNYEGQEWSWDKQRFGRIKYKKTLADAAVDGFIPEGKLASQEKMLAEAKKILQEWIESIDNGAILSSADRPELKVPLPPEQIEINLKRYGDFSQMNARIGSSRSDTTHERFTRSPDEWYLYHSLYKEARKKWVEVPYVIIAETLSRRPDWIVGDFGCGEALLSTIIPNKVFNFDHVAINETVEICDMRKTSLDDGTLDVAVFSLSLMGVNWAEYVSEAYRTLKPGGFIEIAEPISKWDGEKIEELKSEIVRLGFQLVGEPKKSQQFIYLKAVKI